MPQDIIEFGLIGFVTKIFYVVVVLTVGWFVLRRMDWASGVDFKTVLDKIRESPVALALYYGCRLLALAVVCHAVF